MAPDQIVQLDRKLFIKCAKSIDHEYLCIYVDKEDKANKVGSKNTKIKGPTENHDVIIDILHLIHATYIHCVFHITYIMINICRSIDK